jgi:hypothetical protein
MSNDAAKKAAARASAAQRAVTLALLASNALFLLVRVYVRRAFPLAGVAEWATAALVLVAQGSSAFFYVGAKAAGGAADAEVDALALAVCAQLASLVNVRVGAVFALAPYAFGAYLLVRRASAAKSAALHGVNLSVTAAKSQFFENVGGAENVGLASGVAPRGAATARR